jgi:ABC-type polysaccharide/polyol phosphate transport system ATPase subunit
MALIEVDSVSKAFSIPSVRRETVREHLLGMLRPRRFHRLQVLDGVSFDVRPGEALGIMGRNGSGKSTLLKIICGVYPPDRGHVRTRAAITPILELGVGWNPELDAVDNVLLIGSVMGLSLHQIRRSMDEILAFAELERFANLKLMHYSSGMSARLSYAVAFRAVREVLVLDEIFAVGDAGFKVRCEERYLELRAAGHTALIVSHDLKVIKTFCDRALLIEDGRMVLDGPASEVVGRYVSLLTDDNRVVDARSAVK